jgi:hypothetical protein
MDELWSGWKKIKADGSAVRRELKRLNGFVTPEGVRRIDESVAWIRQLQLGIEGNYQFWRGLCDGVEGIQLIDWTRPERNRYAVSIRSRMPVDARKEDGTPQGWLYPQTMVWINGLPVILVMSMPKHRGLWHLWRLAKEYHEVAKRWMTLIQIVVMIQERLVWVAPSWNLPKRAPGRSAMLISDPNAWMAKVFSHEQILAWLRRGVKFNRVGGIAGPIEKTVVIPDWNGDLPGWLMNRPQEPRPSGERRNNAPWTPEEKRRREEKLGDWMEKRFRSDYRTTPRKMAYWASHYLYNTEMRLMPWLIKVAQRVKARVRMQRHRTAIMDATALEATDADCKPTDGPGHDDTVDEGS